MWFFREISSGEIIRNPHEEEFFTEQTGLEAIVREGIQNSLDARTKPDFLVGVRFLKGRAPKEAGFIFDHLTEHLSKSGINAGQIGTTSFEYLAIEDFNTIGLSGKTSFEECLQNEEGNYCNFWWVDGSTRKGLKKGGRWGLGKYSFFIFSKVKNFFGISIAYPDGPPLLLGRALLKRHNIDGKSFVPDGVYANSNFDPITDISVIDELKEYFHLERHNRSGLSLIIPYPEMDDVSDPSADILDCVMDNYLYSIISGNLSIRIEDESEGTSLPIVVNKDSAREILRHFSRVDEKFKKYEHFHTLFSDILEKEPDYTLALGKEDLPEIDEFSFSGSVEEIRKKYTSLGSSVLKIRIPFRISKKSEDMSQETYVDVSISRDSSFSNEKVYCIRSGIKVNDGIKAKFKEGVIFLIAEDEAAAEFLGDAETPAHNEWNLGTEKLRSGKYASPNVVLGFIRNLPGTLYSILSKKPEEEDRDILIDLFYTKGRSRSGLPKKHVPPGLPPEPRKKIFNLTRVTGGFRISVVSGSGEKLPRIVVIRTAYDTEESGNPFRKHSEFDYVIGEDNVTVDELRDCEILNHDKNTLTIRVDSENFALSVTGFDQKRDLIVDVKSKEVELE